VSVGWISKNVEMNHSGIFPTTILHDFTQRAIIFDYLAYLFPSYSHNEILVYFYKNIFFMSGGDDHLLVAKNFDRGHFKEWALKFHGLEWDLKPVLNLSDYETMGAHFTYKDGHYQPYWNAHKSILKLAYIPIKGEPRSVYFRRILTVGEYLYYHPDYEQIDSILADLSASIGYLDLYNAYKHTGRVHYPGRDIMRFPI
jgi:hypothetical protein